MPMEMKNRLENSERKGTTSANICAEYSLSERINPAANAPSASERPASCVAQQVASRTAMVKSRNTSGVRMPTIQRIRAGSA
jgi:hypothetical protein